MGLWTALFHRPLQESICTVTVSSASLNSCLKNKVLFTEPSQNCDYVTLGSKPSGIKKGVREQNPCGQTGVPALARVEDA